MEVHIIQVCGQYGDMQGVHRAVIVSLCVYNMEACILQVAQFGGMHNTGVWTIRGGSNKEHMSNGRGGERTMCLKILRLTYPDGIHKEVYSTHSKYISTSLEVINYAHCIRYNHVIVLFGNHVTGRENQIRHGCQYIQHNQ